MEDDNSEEEFDKSQDDVEPLQIGVIGGFNKYN
jgi:hypothetical protein